jgi:peptide/nickel transport system ATP-binding protein
MNTSVAKAAIEKPILEIQKLVITYLTREEGELAAIRNLDLAVGRGETFGIVGESGCGKTTLALAIMGYLGRNGRVAEGHIFLDGDDLIDLPDTSMRRIWGQKLSMVYQDPSAALNPSMKVGKQIQEILQVHQGLTAKESHRQAVDMLQKVQITDPEIVINNYPHEFSGGMRQRVCIAMAVVARPLLIIMDEPTTSLDVTIEAEILDMIRDLKETLGTTILYITHDLGVVSEVSNRVGVMYAGQFVEIAATDELVDEPLHPYTIGLLKAAPKLSAEGRKTKFQPIPGYVVQLDKLPLGCKFNPRCPYSTPECKLTEPKLKQFRPGHFVRCHEVEAVTKDATAHGTVKNAEQMGDTERFGSPILITKDVKTYFGHGPFRVLGNGTDNRVRAVDGVSIAIQHGLTLGVVGESGSGKTTLARTIIGLEKLTEGEVFLEEKDISRSVSKRDKKTVQQIAIVFQDPQATLNPRRKVRQAIVRPLKLSGANSKEAMIKANELLAAVELGPEHMNRYPSQLSGGQRQRVAIARAFASQPKLIIFDEPTSSLDVSIQASVVNLLLKLQRELHVSYMYISHDLAVISCISHYIAVMYLGKVLEVGPAADVLNPPYHPYTEALLSSVPIYNPEIEQRRIRLSGIFASARRAAVGCRFHGRCPRKVGAICETEQPPERRVGDHSIACHITLEELAGVAPVLQRAKK